MDTKKIVLLSMLLVSHIVMYAMVDHTCTALHTQHKSKCQMAPLVEEEVALRFLKEVPCGDFVRISYYFSSIVNKHCCAHAEIIIPQLRAALHDCGSDHARRLVLLDIILECLANSMMVMRPFYVGFALVDKIFSTFPELWERVCIDFPTIDRYRNLKPYQLFFVKILKRAGYDDHMILRILLSTPEEQGVFSERLDCFIIYIVLVMVKNESYPFNSLMSYLQNFNLSNRKQLTEVLVNNYLKCFIFDNVFDVYNVLADENSASCVTYKIEGFSFLEIAAITGCIDLFTLFRECGHECNEHVFKSAVVGGMQEIIDTCLLVFGSSIIDEKCIIEALKWQRNSQAFYCWNTLNPGKPFIIDPIFAIVSGNIEWFIYGAEYGDSCRILKTKNFWRIARAKGNAAFTMMFAQHPIPHLQQDCSYALSFLDCFHERPYKVENKIQIHPMHQAASEGNASLLQRLLENGGDCNEQDSDGETPLHLAVMGQKYQCIEVLLRHDAYVYTQNSNGLTPLHCAAMLSDNIIIKMLLSSAPYEEIPSKIVPLSKYSLDHDVPYSDFQRIALKNNRAAYCRESTALEGGVEDTTLLHIGYNIALSQKTPLYIALFNQNIEGIKIMLEHGALIDEFLGRKDFMLSVFYLGCSEILVYLLARYPFLFNAKFEEGNTLLHYAVYFDDNDMVDYLIQNNVDVNVQNDAGETPLFGFACDLFVPGTLEGVKKFLAAGAKVNIFNNKRQSPLSLIAKFIAKSFKEHGNHNDELRRVFGYLIAVGASLQPLYDEKKIYITTRELAEFFYNYGYRFDAYNKDGESMLHMLVMNYCKIGDHLFDIMEFIIHKGIDLNIVNKKKQTILHILAGKKGSENIVNYLIQHGADTTACDLSGRLPYHYACSNELRNMLSIELRKNLFI